MLRELISSKFKDIIKVLWRINIVNSYLSKEINYLKKMLRNI
jgi:hypothetical protein